MINIEKCIGISLFFIYGILYYLTINHKNYKKRKLSTSYYCNTIINILIVYIIILFFLNFYTFSNNILPNFKNILFCFIITDTIYYWVHKIIHRTPFLKQLLHLTHHAPHKIVPFDIFNINHSEHILYVCLQHLPFLFIPVNRIEYCIVVTISFIHATYIHSESKHNFFIPLFINSKYHKNHHRIGGGNYSIYFSMWDDYMNTKIKSRLPIKNKL